MKITVQFENLAEFQKFIGAAGEVAEEKKAAPAQVEAPKPDKKKAAKEEQEEAKEEAKAAEPEEVKAEEPKECTDYGAIRVECRQVLAALNKAVGRNVAKEMLAAHGAKDGKLSQIEDMFLPALLEEAKEALENAK